ncbi:MAG: hypothetical protein IJO61_05135 [Oscillospiraceae bacterium]|nr:hypothetical protein [Oscillospiraceae bacterium]
MKKITLLTVCVLLLTSCELNSRVIQTKDWDEIYVDDQFDYNDMMNPPEKYSQLEQIDKELRADVSKYMKENNLCLKRGKQDFVRINPSYEWLINDTDGYGFVFENIE